MFSQVKRCTVCMYACTIYAGDIVHMWATRAYCQVGRSGHSKYKNRRKAKRPDDEKGRTRIEREKMVHPRECMCTGMYLYADKVGTMGAPCGSLEVALRMRDRD